MGIRGWILTIAGMTLAVLRPALGAAALVAQPGYVVGAIPLPGVANGDVAVAGTSIFTGQGSFGANGESIIRVDADGTVTTVVTGLNAIGGIAYDAANDRLIFSDNGGELTGATTGDTIFGLSTPRTAAGPVAASGLTMAPAGSIPFAQAVLPLPSGSVLVGDAAGGGAGRIVKVTAFVGSNVVTGLDYTSGLALTSANVLLVGDVDSTTFVGSVSKYDLTGMSQGSLASGLSGAYDMALDGAGNLLLSGTFIDDFSSSTIVSITPGGAVSQLASGFAFSTGLDIDRLTGEVLVVDSGALQIDTLTPVNGLTPGGKGRKECQVEAWGGAPDRAKNGTPKTRWTCTDGAACDRDGTVNGSCSVLVGGCFSITDARTPTCISAPVDSAVVSSHQIVPALSNLQNAIDAVLPSTGAVCSAGVPISVAANGKTISISLDGTHAGKRADKDTLKLRCLPPGA
ncbi:MAG TPA: hypothetical protein VGK30_00055 [Candidatus Binatia bacterium]